MYCKYQFLSCSGSKWPMPSVEEEIRLNQLIFSYFEGSIKINQVRQL